jgi:hypothetical protein
MGTRSWGDGSAAVDAELMAATPGGDRSGVALPARGEGDGTKPGMAWGEGEMAGRRGRPTELLRLREARA